ncbi:MAG: SIR2 family protein [Phaeodactylibacter sp.]|nr:SIR2 family protein [Phaeodactylibacter sp.]
MPETEMLTLSNVDWDDILETLSVQRCVLFLGASAYQAPGGGDLETALRRHLDADDPAHPYIHVYNSDGFILLRKNRYRRKVVTAMSEFYSQPFPETEALFARIARIPFSMIFTLTPDNVLPRTFDVQGFDYQPDFYFRNSKAAEQFEQPHKDKPVIYNLLGNIEEPRSMVLTHADFFDYLQSVFTGYNMNQELKDELEQAERYVFLGLPYEKWYFQLLLRVLSMHSEKLKEVERLALMEFENPLLYKLYTEEFKIEFIPSDTEVFIQTLFQHCETAGLLKQPLQPGPAEVNVPVLPFAELREMVAKAKSAQAMLHLKALLDSKKPRSYQLANSLVVLRNRYNLLRQREKRGTIDSRDLTVEDRQITEQLLELIAQSETLTA